MCRCSLCAPGARPPPGKLQFANDPGNKIVLWSTGASDGYGFGMNSTNLSVFVPPGSRFSLRKNNHAGSEHFELDAEPEAGASREPGVPA